MLQSTVLCLYMTVHLLLEEFKISLKSSLCTQSLLHTIRPRVGVQESESHKKQDLASLLRPTTHECMHLVMSGHTIFRLCYKDGCHAIRSAIAKNPTLHANLMALCIIEADQSFTRQEYAFSTFSAPVILTR